MGMHTSWGSWRRDAVGRSRSSGGGWIQKLQLQGNWVVEWGVHGQWREGCKAPKSHSAFAFAVGVWSALVVCTVVRVLVRGVSQRCTGTPHNIKGTVSRTSSELRVHSARDHTSTLQCDPAHRTPRLPRRAGRHAAQAQGQRSRTHASHARTPRTAVGRREDARVACEAARYKNTSCCIEFLYKLTVVCPS